mmetsp:Transcript_65224/g.196873  ORF Transcript_65224/g.196873 Transcript_65224/m.196873 type:complete len:323 (-) Transcript_65224:126-1094(-)
MTSTTFMRRAFCSGLASCSAGRGCLFQRRQSAAVGSRSSAANAVPAWPHQRWSRSKALPTEKRCSQSVARPNGNAQRQVRHANTCMPASWRSAASRPSRRVMASCNTSPRSGMPLATKDARQSREDRATYTSSSAAHRIRGTAPHPGATSRISWSNHGNSSWLIVVLAARRSAKARRATSSGGSGAGNGSSASTPAPKNASNSSSRLLAATASAMTAACGSSATTLLTPLLAAAVSLALILKLLPASGNSELCALVATARSAPGPPGNVLMVRSPTAFFTATPSTTTLALLSFTGQALSPICGKSSVRLFGGTERQLPLLFS